MAAEAPPGGPGKAAEKWLPLRYRKTCAHCRILENKTPWKQLFREDLLKWPGFCPQGAGMREAWSVLVWKPERAATAAVLSPLTPVLKRWVFATFTAARWTELPTVSSPVRMIGFSAWLRVPR
jgi:hypothetical protein